MERNIVCYDVETTGLSTKEDYVIQLSAVKFNRNFEIIDKFDNYINPTGAWHMSDGAEMVHGLSTEFILSNGRPMSEVGKEFLEFTDGCDILSYNGNKFDIKMLSKDLRLAGYEFELSGRTFYDSYLLETKLNPRTLSGIYLKYTGNVLEGAHNSLNDVIATVEVFKHQLEMYERIGQTIENVKNFDESKLLCVDGSIKRCSNPNTPEQLVFAYGKYKDMDIMQVCKIDEGYINWFMTKNDSVDSHTKKIIREYYSKNRHLLK